MNVCRAFDIQTISPLKYCGAWTFDSTDNRLIKQGIARLASVTNQLFSFIVDARKLKIKSF